MFTDARFFRVKVILLILSLVIYLCLAPRLFAFDVGTTLATPTVIVGDVQSGDIISYNPETQIYQPAQEWSDERVFGVVVSDPVFYMRDETVTDTHPVIRFGETTVNVTDWSGPVKAGDLVTTSHIVGMGQRMPSEESGYVVGFALTDAEYGDDVQKIDEKDVRTGQVLVALQVGYIKGKVEIIETEDQETEEDEKMTWYKLFRFVIGALVVVFSIIIVIRRITNLFSQSVISVGRNPLAHSKIRSIVIWNAILIVIIGGIGIGVGVALIII